MQKLSYYEDMTPDQKKFTDGFYKFYEEQGIPIQPAVNYGSRTDPECYGTGIELPPHSSASTPPLSAPHHPLRGISQATFQTATIRNPAVSVAIQQAADRDFVDAVTLGQQRASMAIREATGRQLVDDATLRQLRAHRDHPVVFQAWELNNSTGGFTWTTAIGHAGLVIERLKGYEEEFRRVYKEEYCESNASKWYCLTVGVLTLGWAYLPCCMYHECHKKPKGMKLLHRTAEQFNAELREDGINIAFRFEPINEKLRVTLQ